SVNPRVRIGTVSFPVFRFITTEFSTKRCTPFASSRQECDLWSRQPGMQSLSRLAGVRTTVRLGQRLHRQARSHVGTVSGLRTLAEGRKVPQCLAVLFVSCPCPVRVLLKSCSGPVPARVQVLLMVLFRLESGTQEHAGAHGRG